MRALSMSSLGAAVIAGAILGISVAALLVSLGMPLPVSTPTLILTLLGVGIIALLLTIPLVDYRRRLDRYLLGKTKDRPERVNPFYAYRVLMWARASALAGAGFLGWHIGQLVWLGSFAVLASAPVQSAGLGASASAALVILAWVAERNCRAPEDQDGESGAAS
jgi:membrane protein implicated in regulation of membrane protease activity